MIFQKTQNLSHNTKNKKDNQLENDNIKESIQLTKELKNSNKDIDNDNKEQKQEDISISISTCLNSFINNSTLSEEISKSFKNDNTIISLDQKIDINGLRKEREENINKKIEKIKEPLSYYEKRKKVLQEEKTDTYNIKELKFPINIESIKQDYKKQIIEKMHLYNMNKEDVLKNSKTTIIKINNPNMDNNNNNSNYLININNLTDSSSIQNQSTKCDSKDKEIINDSNISNQVVPRKEEKYFNRFKVKYYLENKLWDLPLYQQAQESSILIPEKYKIDEKVFGYVYSNDYNTFCITTTYFLGEEDRENNELDNNDMNSAKFDNSTGLYFCGKEIKIENWTKICAKNNFICKECMKINKKKYHIKNNYLINIKGRVAKINKGSYHCFGRFLCENQIQECINRFCCEACNLVNDFHKYYN